MTRIDPETVQILWLEMQPAIVASVATVRQTMLRKAAKAVQRIGGTLGLPVLASVVPLGSAPPELIAELHPLEPATRTTVTPFGDSVQRRRMEMAGRKVLAVGGVSSEIAIVNTVLDARRAGYDVHLLLDCCGGLSDRTEAAALRQMELAGAVPSNVSSLFTAMIDDMTTAEGGAVMGALAELWSWDVGGAAPASPQAQVKALFEDLQGAWRAGDAARFSSLFTRGARFVAFDGAALSGREAIAAYHATPFATSLGGTDLALDVQGVRALAQDVLLVSSQGGIVGIGAPEGRPTGLSAQTFVVVRQDGALLVDAFQNTRIRPIEGPATAAIWTAFDQAWSSRPRAGSAD